MKSLRTFALLIWSVTLFLYSPSAFALNEEEAERAAIEAYVYGYPLVTMDLTRRVLTNVETPDNLHAPLNQFARVRTYPDPSVKVVTAPNADTLYTVAFLDLAAEPIVLHAPDTAGRYYLMPLLDGYTNVFAVPGKRTTGTGAGDFAIVGPHWKGELPKGVTKLQSGTNLVWLLGRIYCTGTKEDYAAVHALQDQFTLTPLSQFGKAYTPGKGSVDKTLDMKTPVRDQVNAMSAEAFFGRLASLLKDNPPTAEDVTMVQNLKSIGIVAGQEFSLAKLDSAVARGVEKAPKPALARIIAHAKVGGKKVNNWTFSAPTGLYGTDYLQRAYITYFGLGANRPQDAIYPNTTQDRDGKNLNGAHKYILRFPKGQLPPVKGFWSLTMYDDQYFFYANPLKRQTISQRDKLAPNEDGSIDILLQHESPGKEKEANWLPAPKGDFVLMLRTYWPDEAVIKGEWSAPGIIRVD